MEVHARSDSAEDRAANRLAQLILDSDPDARTSGEVHICIVSNLQCYGQSPQDIDLALVLLDRRTKPFVSSAGVALRGCCVAVEVKSHDPAGVVFEGSTCIVKYHGDEHNVTMQSEGQKYSLRGHLQRHLNSGAPFINNLIWLPGLPKSVLPRVASNLVAADSTWQDIVDVVASLSRPESGEIKNIRNARQFFDLTTVLVKRLEPGKLDRRKMEIVAQRVTQADAQYLSKLGTQLLTFRGRGGTGKTIRLLQLAYRLYQEQGARVLLLTYNNALAADISRLLALLGIQDGIGERAIGVRTVHKLMRDWLTALGLLEPRQPDFLDEYENLKSELLALLNGGALTSRDIAGRKRQDSRDLTWDFVFVDECQDWPENERDIIYRLYDYKNCVLADGVDQLVRTSQSTDWRETIDRSASQIVPLRKSLRLKAGLCEFVSEFAGQLGVQNWDLQPEPDIYGGKVVVLAGVDYERHLHNEFTDDLRSSGNCPIDMLHCVPPHYVHASASGEKTSTIAEKLGQWGCEVWDGTSYSVRSSYPTSVNQHRIVQYDSCRGLEGWTVVCLSLDRFFDYKLARYDGSDRDLLADPLDLARAFASRWTMIPLTRAIDTLVLHVEDLDHPLSKALKTTAARYPAIVKWST